MSTALDLTRLEKVRTVNGKTIARCPACAEGGGDNKCDHLFIGADGRFGCVMFPGPAGAEHRKRIFELVGVPTETKATSKTWATVEDAANALASKEGGTLGGTWKYQNTDGADVLAVVRVNLATGRKTFRPFKRTVNGWSVGDSPGSPPLYRLRELQANNSAPVYCVEGEKCADASRSLGLLATTSAHGAKSAHKTDWTPLAGRDVVLLPDNDEDGKAYADTVAAILELFVPVLRGTPRMSRHSLR